MKLMPARRLIYGIIAAFFAGNFILILIQYNSDKNISSLIEANQRAVRENRLNDELRSLESHIQRLERAMYRHAGRLEPADDLSIPQLMDSVVHYRHSFAVLARQPGVADKVQHLSLLLDSNHAIKKRLVRQQADSNPDSTSALLIQGRRFTDSIVYAIREIVQTRQQLLVAATTTVDEAGYKVRAWSTILFICIVAMGAVLFWYIVDALRTQAQLIAQVRQSEQEVRQVAEIKEHFLANMSHEIRTPLNAILGFAQLLQQKNLDKESRNFLQTIQRSGQGLMTIINDILDLSRIEAGKMHIELQPFEPATVLSTVVNMLQPVADAKGLVLLSEMNPDGWPVVEGDANRLLQVWTNLLNNAIKFTPKGAVGIRVWHEQQSGKSILLHAEVWDTGIGISATQQAHIFDRFRQVEGGTSRHFGGTGLGLAIVRELVGLQGGTVEVISAEGKGSTFKMAIPYPISQAPVDSSESVGNELPHLAGRSRVLVAEDNDINKALLEQLLGNWNINSTFVGNGAEAVAALQKEPFDLVLMDIQMPVLDGYATTRHIRNSLQMEIPIIAMTAHALNGEREKCISAGMNEYITKPISIAALAALLQKYSPDKPAGRHGGPSAGDNGFGVLCLDYLKEVSGGDLAYEQKVMLQFVAAAPDMIQAMKQAYRLQDAGTLASLAHNLKTTLSVAGLNDRLNPYLDVLENVHADDDHKQQVLQEVEAVLQIAVADAERYLRSIH